MLDATDYAVALQVTTTPVVLRGDGSRRPSHSQAVLVLHTYFLETQPARICRVMTT